MSDEMSDDKVSDEMTERVAKVLKAGRGCDNGDVPCPFCLWPPDAHTKEFDETGCVWLAEAVLAEICKVTKEKKQK